MGKFVALLFIALLVVSSLVVVGFVFAQSPPEPSVPEFTVKFVNASYTVTTANSYTGVDETELVSNNSVEITITNQPFSHSNYQICYNVRVKPRFEEDWTEVYPVRRRTSAYLGDGDFSYAEYINDYSPLQSESDYSTIFSMLCQRRLTKHQATTLGCIIGEPQVRNLSITRCSVPFQMMVNLISK